MNETINVFFIDFHNGKVRECVTENEDGSFTVFIDAQLSRDAQIRAYRHALSHINRNDLKSEKDADLIEFEAHNEGGE